jgi:hypothetical protein
MPQRYSAVFLSLLGAIAMPVFAQVPQAGGDSSVVKPIEPKDPVVVQSLNGVKTSSWTELSDRVTVVVAGLHEWSGTGKNEPDDLRLFLAGRILPKAEPAMINRAQNYITFLLDIDPADRDLWVEVLSEARKAEDHRVAISVGVKNTKQPFESNVYVALNVYPWYTGGVLGLLVLLFIGLQYLGAKTTLLRDGALDSPYSLGRVQMACWFYLVIASYLYIWLITGEYNNLTLSVLALIGISGGTGLAAILVERDKHLEVTKQRYELEAEEAALTVRIAELSAENPLPGSSLDQELQEKKNRLAEVHAKIARMPALPPPAKSRGFRHDILRDGDGICFHRFQIVVWTAVFAIIFIRSVYRDLAMPEFNASLLGLMGISSGTYVGFKFPEKPK